MQHRYKMHGKCPKECMYRSTIARVFKTAINVVVVTVVMVCVVLTRNNHDPREQELVWRTLGPLVGDDQRVVDYLHQSYLVAPSTQPYNLSTDAVYKRESNTGSWVHIHAYLQRFFSRERNGFFIESGALDGEYLSSTLWLEMENSWTGLLVEPDEYSYSDLLMKRRKAWISNTCLSIHNYPLETVHVGIRLRKDMPATNRWNYRGMSHGLDINLSNSSLSRYLLRMADQTYQRVQCFPLVSYLKALNVSTVDLLVLDMQGAEKGVLRALPWQDLNIRVMVVELTEDVPDVNFLEYIKAKGYYLIEEKLLTDDYIFVKNGDKVLTDLLSSNA